MVRAVLGVIVGYAVWTVVWLGVGLTVFAASAEAAKAGESVTGVGVLSGYLVLSVVCSLAAGASAAVVGGKKGWGAAMATAVLLLLTGIGVQASAWSLMPVWYHLSFLVLLVPVTLVGARLVSRKEAV